MEETKLKQQNRLVFSTIIIYRSNSHFLFSILKRGRRTPELVPRDNSHYFSYLYIINACILCGQFTQAEETAIKLDLDGLVVIGGDDSNTNACLLAEYFR